MGLFVQLGVCRRIKPQNCLIVPLNLPPYPVQKVLLIRGAPACNHSGGRFDQSSSHVVTLNRRVETAANIRDWRKEESEWRDDSTLVGLSSVCSSPNSSSAVSHWSSAGYGHNPWKRHHWLVIISSIQLPCNDFQFKNRICLTLDAASLELDLPLVSYQLDQTAAAVNLSLTCISISGLKSVFNHYWPFSDRRLTEEVVTQWHGCHTVQTFVGPTKIDHNNKTKSTAFYI